MGHDGLSIEKSYERIQATEPDIAQVWLESVDITPITGPSILVFILEKVSLVGFWVMVGLFRLKIGRFKPNLVKHESQR